MENSKSEDSGVRKRTTYADFIMDDVRWSFDASLTIVFSHEEACFDLQCLQRCATKLALKVLPPIKADLASLASYLTEVRFAVAFAGGAEMAHHLPSVCSIVQRGLQLEDTQPAFVVYCNSFIVPSPADGETMYFDVREQIARETHALHPTTYYLFTDSRVHIESPSWLLASLLSLLEDRAANEPGVAFLGKEWVQALTEVPQADSHAMEDYDARALLAYPTNPILHGSYFDLFPEALFLNPVHPMLNNYLLMDVYRSTQSLFSYDVVSFLSPLKSHLLMKINQWMESYASYLEVARGRYLAAVSRRYYPKNPFLGLRSRSRDEQLTVHGKEIVDEAVTEEWSVPAYLGLQVGDVLWRHYCTHWLNNCTETRPTLRTWKNPEHSPPVNSSVSPRRQAECFTDSCSASLQDSQPNASSLPSPPATANAFLFSQSHAKVAVITTVIGSYEASCKAFARQSIPTDFYCFTDNPSIVNANQGWIVDSTPYHLLLWRREEEHAELAEQVNSLHNNRHPFNTAKFYKLYFPWIPRLQSYQHIIWVDATVRVVDRLMAERVVNLTQQHGEQAAIITWQHSRRRWLKDEVEASVASQKYTVTEWNGHTQPFQDVEAQYRAYLARYPTLEWNGTDSQESVGKVQVWCTCFVAYNMAAPIVQAFLREWQRQVYEYTTQDQISFPAVTKEVQYYPYTLPDGNITGSYDLNTFFVKLPHNL